MKPILFALALAALPAAALAQTGEVTVWTKGVPPGGITEKKDFGDHAMQIGHRDADGKVEIHLGKSDVFVIQSGTATLVTGGVIQEPVTTGPGEILGSSIKGGVPHAVGPGDVVEIPPGVPHQFFLPKGGELTYFVIKVVRTPAVPAPK